MSASETLTAVFGIDDDRHGWHFGGTAREPLWQVPWLRLGAPSFQQFNLINNISSDQGRKIVKEKTVFAYQFFDIKVYINYHFWLCHFFYPPWNPTARIWNLVLGRWISFGAKGLFSGGKLVALSFEVILHLFGIKGFLQGSLWGVRPSPRYLVGSS